jgi:hypothetical protein
MKSIVTLALLHIGYILCKENAPHFTWSPEIGFIGSPSDSQLNWRPIVGVLTQAIDDGMRKV